MESQRDDLHIRDTRPSTILYLLNSCYIGYNWRKKNDNKNN